jgi:mono/diheme cytochrome c family protein
MRGALLLLLLALAGCHENMVQQPRYDAFESAPLYDDGMAMQPPPAGTVDRDTAVETAAAERPPLTPALLQRGRERFEIYCAPCHGSDGRGDGVIPARGFPNPPSYLEPRLIAAPTSHFYDVITHGYGVMYSYADRVPPHDRWAIAAYIRALQAAGSDSRVLQRKQEPRATQDNARNLGLLRSQEHDSAR